MDEARAKWERRLNRRELWASLWLKRILAFLDLFNGETLPRFWRKRAGIWLTHIEKSVLDFFLSRALLNLQSQNRRTRARGHTPQSSPFPSFRPLIGGALRRALKAKTLRARAHTILRVLRMRDAYVAKLVYRLRRGMSRAWSKFSRVTPSLHRPAGGSPPPAARGEELRTGLAPP